MSALSWLRRIYWCHLGQPAVERTLYRACRRQPPRSIVEIGVGTGQRLQRLLEFVLAVHPASDVRYVGIDLFEARPAATPGLSLKQAHALFKPLGVHVRLVPGDPHAALMRVANTVRDIDLLIVNADVDATSLHNAWRFVPRMLGGAARVFLQTAGKDALAHEYRELSRGEVDNLAAPPKPVRQAA